MTHTALVRLPHTVEVKEPTSRRQLGRCTFPARRSDQRESVAGVFDFRGSREWNVCEACGVVRDRLAVHHCLRG